MDESTRSWVQVAVGVWENGMGGSIPYGRVGKALKPLVDEHGETTVLAVLDRYLARHVREGRADFATPEGLAQRFGAEQERRANGRGNVITTVDEDDLLGWGATP